MNKYLVNIKTNNGMLVDCVCDDVNIAQQLLCDVILGFFESKFKNLLTDDLQNYYAYELNEYLSNGDYVGLIKFANNISTLYRTRDEIFCIDTIQYLITMQSIAPINGVSSSRALVYKSNQNLFSNNQMTLFNNQQQVYSNNTPSHSVASCDVGATCRSCNDYNEYAVPDGFDGKITCTKCKLWKQII